MGIFNADVIINIPPAFFSLQKSGLVRVYLTSVFLLLSVPRCFGDQKPQFDYYLFNIINCLYKISIVFLNFHQMECHIILLVGIFILDKSINFLWCVLN